MTSVNVYVVVGVVVLVVVVGVVVGDVGHSSSMFQIHEKDFLPPDGIKPGSAV